MPRGTTVAGVDVGGRTLDSAAAELERGLAARVDAEIDVTAGEVQRGIVPAAAGLSVDYAASVADAGAQRSWSPAWLWDYYNGGDDLEAVVAVDAETQQAFLSELSAEVRTPAREGEVRLTATGVDVTDPTTGEDLDTTAAAAELEAAYLSESAVVLPMVTMRPDIDSADVEAAVRDFANPAMSAPVTLRFGSASARLSPREYAAAISLEPQGGVLAPVLKPEKLDELLSATISGDGAAVDATVRLVDGSPQVVPARPGVTYEPDAVHSTFLDLVTRPQGERETEVPSTVAKPEFSTKDARALGIDEQVSTFTTYFPYAEYRNINIGRAAEIIDGTVLKPGETFSLNGTVGERTRANGFTEGFIISDGIFKEDLGGGVSQVATTTFNAAFFAGLEDVEHKPHSFYIDRYPVGREATVAWPTVDLKFTNDTPYGVLISTSLQPSTPSSSGALTVSMWSTKLLGHHRHHRRALQLHQPRHPEAGHRGLLPQRGLRRVRHRRHPRLPPRRRERRRPPRGHAHALHPQRHRHLRVAVYGASRVRSRGKSVTSRMLAASTSRATQRSSPMAKPPCGGMPCRKAWRYAVYAAGSSPRARIARSWSASRCSRWPPVTSSSPRKSRSKLLLQRGSVGCGWV